MNSFVNYLFTFAAIQGFIIAISLLFKKDGKRANKFLSLMVTFLSLDLLSLNYYLSGFYLQFPWFAELNYPFTFLYGPLFYFYISYETGHKERFRLRDYLHFIPVAVIYMFMSPLLLMNAGERIDNLHKMSYNPPLWLVVLSYLRSWIGFVYSIMTIRLLISWDYEIREVASNTDQINLIWFKRLAIGFMLIWVIVLTSTTAMFAGLIAGNQVDFYIYPFVALIIYLIGYMGLIQPQIFLKPLNAEEPDTAKYEKSGLDDSAANEILKNLDTLMTGEKLYLNPDLSLSELADTLNTSTHRLSEAINSRINKNFYDYVNEMRIEHFKREIKKPGSEVYNILSIALDSGFNSKATFNRVFRKYTGMTPSEFVRSEQT